MRATIGLVVFLGIASAAQFAAYSISRPVGDFTFLALSASIPFLSNIATLSQPIWLVRSVLALVLTAVAYSALAAFASWIRSGVLQLSESFGQSALAGIVWIGLFGLCMFVTLLVTLLWWLFTRNR
ncbi:MAG: hypothetical protein Q8L84_11310 [Hyphomonas sp.]|nr:hypothetical protein [Hyphomonas sp.]